MLKIFSCLTPKILNNKNGNENTIKTNILIVILLNKNLIIK
jgi:hypothetical protein